MEIYTDSIKGKRESNEDAHNVIINMNNRYPDKQQINYFSIFDGHGGPQVSNFLSKVLYKYFFEKNLPYPLTDENIKKIYNDVDKILRTRSYAYESGSTALVMVHYKTKNAIHHLNILNSGDCRAVLCRNNFAIPLTKDHKPSHPEERNRIEKLGGEIYFDGYDYRIKNLSVSRAFGDYDAIPYVTHLPEIYRYTLTKNDKFIVLGCDGLWDVLSNTDVINFVLLSCYDSNMKKHKSCPNIAKQLTELAYKKGSTDNISVTVIFFDNK